MKDLKWAIRKRTVIGKYICNQGNAKYNHEETLFHIHPTGKISSMTILCVSDDAE